MDSGSPYAYPHLPSDPLKSIKPPDFSSSLLSMTNSGNGNIAIFRSKALKRMSRKLVLSGMKNSNFYDKKRVHYWKGLEGMISWSKVKLDET